MLNRIAIKGFKSFREVDIRLGAMNLLVGTNGSGKSNLLDALRVLQGVGNGYTIGEILDGKPKSATNEAWEGIRGGSSKACFEGNDSRQQFAIEVEGQFDDETWTYRICVEPRPGRVADESLRLGKKLVYCAQSGDGPVLNVTYMESDEHLCRGLERARPALDQLQRHEEVREFEELFGNVATQLADMQRIDPAPSILRDYSTAFVSERIGERGENLATMVSMFDEDQQSSYVDWLRELRPQEVDNVTTLQGALEESMFAIVERGREFPAPVLSDGTLRFAAIAAAFYQFDMPGVMTIEEIEKGLHPSRVRVMVEMLRANSSSRTQIMATTHSPTVVAWLEPDEHKTTFVFARDPDTGESTVTPLVEIEGFERIVADQELADLFAEGWMESAL